MLERKFDEVPWTIQQTFLGILLTIVPWVVLSFVISLLSTNSSHVTRLSPQTDLVSAFVTFFLATLIEATFLIAPLYFARRFLRQQPEQGWKTLQIVGLRRFHWGKAFLWIFALFVLVVLVNVLYQNIITALHLNWQTNDQRILEQGRAAPLTTYATLLASVLIAPVCEEIFFRGFVFMGLLRGMSLLGAVVFSALVFAVAHADPASFAVLFIIGLALAFLRWHTRSLWPPILLHLLNNGIGALLIFLAMHGGKFAGM